jgi:hypothetical protein
VTHGPARAPHRTLAVLATFVAACLAPPVPAVAAAAPPAAHPFDREAAVQLVRQAREFENHNAYSLALGEWRRLRAVTPLDGDLELTTAVDEARAGQLDSAEVRLAGPILSAAAVDTLPVTRYRYYTGDREGVYVNGGYDGWHWYVWRARAEVAAARGQWAEAITAARRCVAARPVSGKDWLLLALCAAHAGQVDEARDAALRAIAIDVTVPEAHYLAGVLAWRAGRTAEAQARFRSAVAIDSTAPEPALALVRSRLPGATPDSLPTDFLTGRRVVAMLTSSAGPKLEEFVQADQGVGVTHHEDPVLPDTLSAMMKAQQVPVWLYVDETGRVVLNEVPWSSGHEFPVPVISGLIQTLSRWRFQPATVRGEPRPAWIDFDYVFPR